MYDKITAQLIKNASALEKIKIDLLPEELTKAYADIVSARLKFREYNSEEKEMAGDELTYKIRKIACSYEVLISLSSARSDRQSIGFVAATAHLLCFNAGKINAKKAVSTFINSSSISSNISALLLFMISESISDAMEVSKYIETEFLSGIELEIVNSLKNLANGRLSDISNKKIEAQSFIKEDGLFNNATKALYYKILIGLGVLAKELLSNNSHDLVDSEAERIFSEVIDLSRGDEVLIRENDIDVKMSTSFSGPHHLATLLLMVSRYLPKSSIARIPPPKGIGHIAWNRSLKKIKLERPYLWRNHIDAINKGFLEPGVSSVISFPTGAGKSTLSELKITTHLLLGRRVIFLAPTHSLVDQTNNFLNSSFPKQNIGYGDEIDEDMMQGVPDILVLTPEACLNLMIINPNYFINIGLVVFDECHLLHASSDRSRRAIDAMLCILNLRRIAPNADFLLISAMVKNAVEMSNWLRELTNRDCLSLDLAWKPTRQMRGSIVFDNNELFKIKKQLAKSKKIGKSKNPSVLDKKNLVAKPLALFSLKQTWETTNKEDYALVNILDENVMLGANNYWKITPNSGQVSSSIASASASIQVKTLIFFQTVKNAISGANKISELLGDISIPLNDEELQWVRNLKEEFGSLSNLYANIKDGNLVQAALSHHGLLMKEERLLFESLYKRTDGVFAMTATSTIAQGMNLPSELVIIAEDSRFDEATDKREILEAQELLNAAGRAGRAGQNSIGIVLVIPGKVTGINLNINDVDAHWGKLRKIFGQSDQCLTIDDPLEIVLDRIHDNIEITDIDKYTVQRMVSVDNEKNDGIEWVVKSSFAAYRKRREGDLKWEVDKLKDIIDCLEIIQTDDIEDDLSIRDICYKTGFSYDLVYHLSNDLKASGYNLEFNIIKWREWLFKWMIKNHRFIGLIIRKESVISLIGEKKYISSIKSDSVNVDIINKIINLALSYSKGNSISAMEASCGSNSDKCEVSRKFILKIIPDLAYFFSLPALILKYKSKEIGINHIPLPITELGKCTKLGFNRVEKLIISSILYEKNYSRVKINKIYLNVKDSLVNSSSRETRKDMVARVRSVLFKYGYLLDF